MNILKLNSLFIGIICIFSGTINATGNSSALVQLGGQGGSLSETEKPAPKPVAPPEPTNEQLTFFDNLMDSGAATSICKNIQIPLSGKVGIGQTKLGGGYRRKFAMYPDRRLALIDEQEINLGYAAHRILHTMPSIPTSLVGVITPEVKGISAVVRPLGRTSSCNELGTLFAVHKTKTVIPIQAKGIQEMEIGEIWRVPLVFKYTVSLGAGVPVVGGAINVYLGANFSQERKPTISLFRMDEKRTRIRLRLEQIMMESVVGSIRSGDFGIINLGAEKTRDAMASYLGEFTSGVLVNYFANLINDYLATQLSLNYFHADGQQLLLEFIIDPTDLSQAQMAEDLLEGDFQSIRKLLLLGVKFSSFSTDVNAAEGLSEISKYSKSLNSGLDARATFAGTDHYSNTMKGYNFKIPFFYKHEEASGSSYHRYQSILENGKVLHVHSADSTTNREHFNTPVLDVITVKKREQKSIYILNKEDVSGSISANFALYQQYSGQVYRTTQEAREVVQRINGVVKYVGVNGNGINLENSLDVDKLMPCSAADGCTKKRDAYIITDKSYRSMMISFKLAVSEKGLSNFMNTSPKDILKAYLNVMTNDTPMGPLVKEVADLVTVGDDGYVSYDIAEAARRLEAMNPGEPHKLLKVGTGYVKPLGAVNDMVSSANALLNELAEVKIETDWKKKAEKMAALANSNPILSYSDLLRVILQFVQPNEVICDVVINANKAVDGEPDVNQSFSIFATKDSEFKQTIDSVDAKRNSFLPPSTLTD